MVTGGPPPPYGSARHPFPTRIPDHRRTRLHGGGRGVSHGQFLALLADAMSAAMAHPDQHPVRTVLPVDPTEGELIAYYAHHPAEGQRVVEGLRRWAAGGEPVDPAPQPSGRKRAAPRGRPPLSPRARAKAARRLVDTTPLTIDQALAAVDAHGPNWTPEETP